MRALKWLFTTLAVIMIVLIMIVGFGLNNERFLNYAAKEGIAQSGLDISFSKIRGGLYSGLEIEGFNYQDAIKGDVKLDVDFAALKEGSVVINDFTLSHLRIDKTFLASLLQPSETNTTQEPSQKLPIKKIVINHLHIDTEDILYEPYKIDTLRLDVNDFSYDMKENFSGNIKAAIKSNVALADIMIDAKDSHYTAHIDADVEKSFITPYLADSNITLEQLPHIMIDAKGDLENVTLQADIGKGALHLNDITIAPKKILLDAAIGIKSGAIKADINGDIDSSIATLLLKANTVLNTHDINETLHFQTANTITLKAHYLQKILAEHNVTIHATPKLTLNASGNLKAIEMRSRLKEGNITIDKFHITPQKLDIDAHYDVKKEDLKASLLSKVISNVATAQLDSTVRVSLKDINQTLQYQSKAKLIAKEAYLQSELRDSNVSFEQLSPLMLHIVGDAKALDANVSLDGRLAYGELKLAPSIKRSQLHLNLITKALRSSLHVALDSNKGNLHLDSDVKGNLDDINDTLSYTALLHIKDAKAYAGVDLSQIGDIMIDAKGSLKALRAKVDSLKIKADVVSDNFDRFDFNIDTKKLYLGKIYADIASDLKKSFVAVDAKGFYTLSAKEADIKAQLKGFKYNRHTLFTNAFSLKVKGDDIMLSPLHLRSKEGFNLTLEAKKQGENIVAHIKNPAFFADAKVRLTPLHVKADGKISSIAKLLKEIDKVYPVDTTMGIDGKVDFHAFMQGEKVKAEIRSPRITLKEGRLQDVYITALYAPHKVLIPHFDFRLAGFEGKGMNRVVKLSRTGVITFDGENASVDIELENLLHFKATKKDGVTTGKFTTKTLALSYPGYGSTKVTTNLEMYESDNKMAVTGEVRFKETEVNYQSRFLDISKDDDIIIISKKDKSKKENENFIKNTFLDIKVVSDDEILYKVDDGEIEMKPDIRIRKEFGQNQKITGKIKILDGMYDFADKRFKIKEGAVAFRGLSDINPLLDLHVEYDEIDDITIMIDIGGDKNRPKLTFSSIPQKSKKDIFSYLLFGMSASETEGAATSANKAAEKIFGRAVAKDLARELHLDRLDLNRNSDGGIDIKAGKKVKRKMIIYYQNKSTESSIIVERKLNKNWEVDTEVGKLGQSIDFVYRKGFK